MWGVGTGGWCRIWGAGAESGAIAESGGELVQKLVGALIGALGLVHWLVHWGWCTGWCTGVGALVGTLIGALGLLQNPEGSWCRIWRTGAESGGLAGSHGSR